MSHTEVPLSERVDRADQVRVNGVNYKLVKESRVQRALASVFPQKLVLGDYSEESNPLVSTITWDDFRGGMLKEIADLPEDINRSFFTTLNTRHKGHLYLQPRGTEELLEARDNVINGIVQHGTLLYTATDSLNLQDLRAGNIIATLGSSATDMISAVVGGVNTIVVATGDKLYWSSATKTDSSQKITHVAGWRDMLFGVNASAELFFTNDLSSTSIAWTKVAQASVPGGATGKQTGLIVGPDDNLYMVTTAGLFRYDNEVERFNHVFALPDSSNNGIATDVWQGSIFYSQDLEIWRYTPLDPSTGARGVVQKVGLGQDDGLPNDRVGKIMALNHTVDRLYAQVNHRDASAFSAVYEWDERAWQTFTTALNSSIAAGKGFYIGGTVGAGFGESMSYKLIPGFNDGNPILFDGFFRSYSLRQDQLSPTQNDSLHLFGFDNTGSSRNYLITPWIVADGEQTWNALAVTAAHSWVFATQTSSALSNDSDFIRLSYAKNGESSYTVAGTIKGQQDSNGESEFLLPAGTIEKVGVPFSSIRLKVEMQGSAVATRASPDLNRLSLHFRKNIDPLWGFTLMIDAEDESFGLSQEEIRENLKDLFTEKALVRFTFKGDNGTDESYFVAPIGLESAEETGFDNSGRYALRLSEVN